jgi:glucoside 3-dehydrogenase (cytochrome c) catalytic subunit
VRWRTRELERVETNVIRLRLSPRENERAMLADMTVAAAEMLEAIGARDIRPRKGMTSVLNPFLQTHDIRNLFVMDGSSFPSSARQNPTLTIIALAVRSTDYLEEQLRKGEI